MTIRSFWNWLDMFVIGVSCATMCFEVYNYFTVGSLLKGMLAEPDKYTDFQNLAKLSRTFQHVGLNSDLQGCWFLANISNCHFTL